MKMKRRRTCLIPKMSLPNEIITNILLRLRAKSILPFKSVSKNWCSLLSDPYFIKLHNTRSIQHDKFSLILNYRNKLYCIDYASLTSNYKNPLRINDYPFLTFEHKLIFVGSCNGLVCFIHNPSYAINKIYFWNPSTGECKLLPSPECPSSYIWYGLSFVDDFGCGFGFYYDSKLDDYKLLKIQTKETFSSTVELYTLGSNSWKQLVVHDDFPYEITGNNRGVFVNGALHWEATTSRGRNVILSFDVVDEIFKEVSGPKVMNKNLSDYTEIGVLSDNLCLFDNDRRASTGLWVMKEYGVTESWTKLLTIPKDQRIESIFPLKCFNNGDILFQRDWYELGLYNKEKGTTFSKLTLGDFEVVTCVDNLVSLKSRRYFKQEFLDKRREGT